MTAGDLDDVLEWRNSEEVRRYMYTKHKISKNEHQTWYDKKRKDLNSTLLIYECNDVPSGFASIVSDVKNIIGRWGFFMNPTEPRLGGIKLGETVLEYAFHELRLHKLCGEVIEYNERSLRFHEKLGFTEEGRLRQQFFDGEQYHDIVCFGMIVSEWRNIRCNRNEV